MVKDYVKNVEDLITAYRGDTNPLGDLRDGFVDTVMGTMAEEAKKELGRRAGISRGNHVEGLEDMGEAKADGRVQGALSRAITSDELGGQLSPEDLARIGSKGR